MKNFLLWLVFSTCALAQTLPWTGSGNNAWLKQSPNALVLPKAGNYIKLSGQTNQLSVAGGVLLLDGNPIVGPTIYSDDGTLSGDRVVSGDGHLLSFSGNSLFLAESSTGTTIQGGTNLIGIAPSGIEFRTPGLASATNGQILTLVGGLVDYADVVGSSGGQTNWGLVVRDPSDGTAKNTGVTIADIITGGGPGGTNQNFANTDLTATGNRTHDWAGNDLTIQNYGYGLLYGNLGIDIVVGPNAIGYHALPDSITIQSDGTSPIKFFTSQVYNGAAVNGQVATLLDASDGTWDWADPPAGPNFANADLTADGDRTHTFSTRTLTIENPVSFYLDNVEQQISLALQTTGDGLLVDSGIGVSLNATLGFRVNTLLGNGNDGQVLTSDGLNVDYRDLPFPLNGVPTVSAGAGAGGSPTVTLANETDSAFTINLTAGTSPATDDDIAIVSFATTNYVTAPHFSLSPGNKQAATLSGASQVWATTTTTNLTLHSNSTGLTEATNYVWEIIVVR